MDRLDVAHRAAARLDRAEEIGPQSLDVLLIGQVQLRFLMDLLLAPAAWIERPASLPAHVKRPFGAVEVAADTFGLVRRVAGELAVLPRQREVLELIRRHLVVRRIGRLVFRR